MPRAEPSGRFRPADRVRKRREFEEVQRRGRRVTTRHFVLLLYARDDTAGPRLGVVASRKVGTAVVRNRAKRLVREAFRATRDLFTPGTDVVVIARSPLTHLKLPDVAAEWRSASAHVAKKTREAHGDRARAASRDVR